MAKIVQLHRMVSSLAAIYVGPQGEIIGDLGANSLRYQDGATPGGFLLMQGANNLAELTNPAQAVVNLGVGDPIVTLNAAQTLANKILTTLEVTGGVELQGRTIGITNVGDARTVNATGHAITASGLIIQWGFSISTQAPGINVNLPIAFPNAALGGFVTPFMSASQGITAALYFNSLSQINVTASNAGGFQIGWIVFGF